MDESVKALEDAKYREDARRAARIMRLLAVKAAKSALDANLKAAYGDAVERAWKMYDSRLAAIWEAYEAAICASSGKPAGDTNGQQSEELRDQAAAFRRNTQSAQVLGLYQP